MKIENQLNEEFQQKALEELNNSEDKSEAIVKVIQMAQEAQEARYNEMINELKKEEEKAKSDEQYAKQLNLRILNSEEKEFYQKVVDADVGFTFKQDDIIPTSIIDRTLDDIQKTSKIFELINFAPADVKRWVTGGYTGVASWHGLTEELKGQLTAEIKSLNIEVGALDAFLVIPKAVRELSLPFVDKFFMAILREALILGIEEGYLVGDGKNGPIGIYKNTEKVEEDGTHKDKKVNADLTSFTPKGLSVAKKYLGKDGKRTFSKICVVCHPNDEADYVAPAIYDDEGKLVSSYKNLEVVTSIKNPQGKAALVLPKRYTMGFTGFKITKYDQTLALKSADVLVGNMYGNGRADDDNVAYIFDVTKLQEYIARVKVVSDNP